MFNTFYRIISLNEDSLNNNLGSGRVAIQSIISDFGLVLGIIGTLVSLILIIFKISDWKNSILNSIEKMNNWKDNTDDWKKNTDDWKYNIKYSIEKMDDWKDNTDDWKYNLKNSIEKMDDWKDSTDKWRSEISNTMRIIQTQFSSVDPDLRKSIEKIEKISPIIIKGYAVQPGADLKKANFMGEKLQELNLQGIILERANLREANLKEANLRRANLSGANLSWANLENANLIAAILQEVDLEEAILTGADLRRANLEKANLTGAIIDEKCLETILRSNNWEHAKLDSDVKDKLENMSKRHSVENNLLILEAVPTLHIPDKDPEGIRSSIMIAQDKKIKDIMVWVDITHPFIGDLAVDLMSPNGTSVRLHDREGGSRDNIIKTYDVQDTPQLNIFLTENVRGVWQLIVKDYTSEEPGKFNKWGLEISLE